MKTASEKYYALVPVSLFCLVCIYKAAGFEIHDFANYYFSGYFLRGGIFTENVYFPYWFNKEIAALGHDSIFANFAPNSPFLALLFYPLSFLSVMVAKLVFNAISAALFVYSLGRLASFYKIGPVYALLVPVLFFVPIKNELFFGQVYFLLFFFLAEYWLAYEKKKFAVSAIFLAMAILLKIFPVLLLAIFLLRKQYRPLFYTVLFCVALASPTLFFCGSDVWIFYFKNVLSRASAGGIASAYVDNYQSVFMLFKRIFVFEPVENPGGFFSAPVLFSALIFAIKVTILAIGFYISRKVKNELLVFSYWILALILISPYGSTYTFVLMLFPFFALAKTPLSKPKKIAFLSLLFLINNMPLSAFMEKPFPLSYLRLFALIAFFALLLTLVYKSVDWKMVSSIGLASIFAVWFFGKEPAHPEYVLKKSPLLVYDYKIENNRLTYCYWDQKGEHSKSVPIKTSGLTNADLTGNRIYFHGKKIASDDGNKLKPIRVGGKTVYYLSDADRGIGFYTLRKIDLNQNPKH